MVTIYHNPTCSTSRKVLAMISDSGVEPQVIDYQKTPLSREEVRRLVTDAGLTLRQALRRKNTLFDDLGLGDPTLTDDQLLDAIEAHPILLERPFVVTPNGTRLCRPPETVLALLDTPHAK